MGGAATEQETLEKEIMKFKKGDLVEVIGLVSYSHMNGERFILGAGKFSEAIYPEGEVSYGFVWKTPFPADLHPNKEDAVWIEECYLKKINPDGDELSNLTFEELMGKLKTNKLEPITL